MADMTYSDLSTNVQERIGSDRLKQLTNYDATATSLNTSVLEAACRDSIGHFHQISGVYPTKDNYSHIAILVRGVQYFLESYKARDSNIIQNLEKAFFRDCQGMRERATWLPTSNSTLAPSTQPQNALPDMDRASSIWPQNRYNSASQIKEIST